jgi:hypothetical protein
LAEADAFFIQTLLSWSAAPPTAATASAPVGMLTISNHCPVADRVWQFCGALMEPHQTTGVFGVEVEMQLFTLSITDLTTFESVPHEEWAEKEDLSEIGNRFARAMLAANPDFRHRGMCVAIYDEAGMAVSVLPLDTLQ